MRYVRDHRLVVHVFAPRVGPDAEPAARQLAALWRYLHERLNLTEPVPRQPVGVDPPTQVESAATGALAVCRHPTIEGQEAMWVREHDVDCVSVCLVSAGAGAGTGWAQMTKDATYVLAEVDPHSMIGLAFVRTALTDLDPNPGNVHLRADIEISLPSSMSERLHPSWWSSAVETGDAILWRLSQLGGAVDDQVDDLVVVAESSHDDQLGALVWATIEPSLAPLTRYLLYAANLRFHSRVRKDAIGIQQLRAEAHATLDRLSGLLVDPDREPTDEELDQAWRDLGRLQATRAGLIDVLANLQAMHRTVSITLTNLDSVIGQVRMETANSAGQVSTLIGDDLALGTWLRQQLEDDQAYLEAANQRATHIDAMVVRELNRRAQQSAERAQGRQERLSARYEQLTLMSAAIITALLTCLTTVQAIGYRLPISSPLELPVIAASTMAVLFLSTLAVRLPVRGARVLRHIATTALVAATAWLALSVLSAVLPWDLPIGFVLLVVAILAAVAAVGSVWMARRQISSETKDLT
jgi:hypothetical protein